MNNRQAAMIAASNIVAQWPQPVSEDRMVNGMTVIAAKISQRLDNMDAAATRLLERTPPIPRGEEGHFKP